MIDGQPIPRKGKNASDLAPHCIAKKPRKSGHVVSVVRKKYADKDKTPTTWYKKEYEEGQEALAVLEAAISEVYRAVIGELAPKVRAIYDEDKIVGSISKELKDFIPLVEFEGQLEELLDFGLSEIMTMSLIMAEDDFHRGNYGKNGRIDFDMSIWPVTSQIKGLRTYCKLIGEKQPEEAFPFNKNDLKNFPKTENLRAFYWPTRLISSSSFQKFLGRYSLEQLFNVKKFVKEEMYDEKDQKSFIDIGKNPNFIYKKYKTLLKFLLIPPDWFVSVANAHIQDEQFKLKFINFLHQRQRDLANVLLDMKEFNSFFYKNYHMILEELANEFSVRNEQFKEKDADLKIPESEIRQNFIKLWAKTQERKITNQLLLLKKICKKLQKDNLQFGFLEEIYNELYEINFNFYTQVNLQLSDVSEFCRESTNCINKLSSIEEGLKEEDKEILKGVHTRLMYAYESMKLDNRKQSISSESIDSQSGQELGISSIALNPYYCITGAGIRNLLLSSSDCFIDWLRDEKNKITIISALKKAFTDYFKEEDGSIVAWTTSIFRASIGKAKREDVRLLSRDYEKLSLIDLVTRALSLTSYGAWEVNSFNTILTTSLFEAFSLDFCSMSPMLQLTKSESLFLFLDYKQKNLICYEPLLPELATKLREEVTVGIKRGESFCF